MAAPTCNPPVSPPAKKAEILLVALLLVAIGWSYYFAIPENFRQLHSPRPEGYYGLLTEAFLAGQLHLAIPTDPKLLALENPYAGRQGANRPHDMSYYQGRFYLYYGAAPVLFLYLPWRLLTGGYLGESLGMVMMLYGGVLLCAVWLTSARRRWFPEVSSRWLLFLIAVIGFGAPVFSEAANNTFYGVPIAAAFFCLMLALTAADRALAATAPARQAGWLAAASLAWGLAVASRPIYLPGLVALMVPALYLWRTGGREARWSWPGLRLLAATVVPAALVGLAMMTYNYLRFDHPLDFGIRFSMASVDLREARLVGPEFIGKNLSLYLLTTVSFIRYYPFLIVDANTWGLLPHLPFAVLGALFPLTWLQPALRDRRWLLGGLLPAGAAFGNFSLLCLFFGGEERYMTDFVPPLLLLATTTAMALLAWSGRGQSRLCFFGARLLIGGLAGCALIHGLMLALPRYDGMRRQAWFERLLNRPAHLVEIWTKTRHGPVEMELLFPRDRTGSIEPLVSTGIGRHGRDGIMVHYLEDNRIQFSAFHVGRGGPVSEPVEIDYDVPHRLHLALGSLYPPATHPLFEGWPSSQADRIRRRLRVDLDGRTVLQGNLKVHASVPSGLLIGRSNLPRDVSAPAFTGRIIHQQRPGVDRAEAAGFETDSGPVRLTVRFPVRVGDEGLPLIATGNRDAGDMLFVRLQTDGQIRIGHDCFGAGAIVSAPLPYDPTVDQVIEVEMGSLYPPGLEDLPPFARSRLRVALNGNLLIDTSRPFNPSLAEEVEFGFNTLGASSAIDYFPGAIRRIERIPPAPAQHAMPQWGHLRLAVMLPPIPPPMAEPLVVTGRTGRADVLFVRYEPDGSVRFGLDHWGLAVALSEPLQFDRTQPLMLELLSGGLLPPAGHALWDDRDPQESARLRDLLELRVNGRTVLVPPFTPYDNESGDTAIGSNLIRASTCSSGFTGRILEVERLSW